MDQRSDDQGARIVRIEQELKAIRLELDDAEQLLTQWLFEPAHTSTQAQHITHDTLRRITKPRTR